MPYASKLSIYLGSEVVSQARQYVEHLVKPQQREGEPGQMCKMADAMVHRWAAR